jgi:hypothetical protein
MHIFQEVINFIPTGITLFIFLVFLKVNKNIKKIEAGPLKFETKDEAGHNVLKDQNKDTEQDNTIKALFEKIKHIEIMIEKSTTESKRRNAEIDARLDKQYEYIREAALKSCTAVVFADNVPLVEFLDGVFTSLWLGNNGNTISQVTKKIIKTPETLQTYNSELSKFRKTHKKPNAHFESAIEEIHREWH